MRFVLRDLLIDTEARVVHRDDAVLELAELSFDVLVHLIKMAPEPVSNVGFCTAVWGSKHVSDETIAQRISLLRKALGDDPKKPIYIRTVRGVGYAVVGSVKAIETETQPTTIWSELPRNLSPIAFGAGALILALAVLVSNLGPESTRVAINSKPKPITSILVERAREQLGLHQARETDRAINMLREALTQDPTSFDARLYLSFALSTKATKFGGSRTVKQKSEVLARTLINERPKSSSAWSALGYALDSQGRVRESLSAYRTAYQLDPNNTSALSSAAYLHLVRGDLQQALLLEDRARKSSGESSRYAEIQIAHALELIGNPAAEKWRMNALALNPEQVVVLSEVARAHLRLGNPHAALETLAQAQGDDQSAPQILQLRSRAAMALGNFDQARSILDAAGDSGYLDRAAAYAATGDFSQAERILVPAKLTQLEADSWPATRVHLAEITAAMGRESEALRFLSQAVNLGWRDISWLKQSPFVGELMSSIAGRQIEARINQKLEGQRRLIGITEELIPILGAL